MLATLLVIYVWFSILTLASLFLVIWQTVATIKRKYPNYRGEMPATSTLIFSIFKMIVISFIPLFNLLVFWTVIFHTDEIVNDMIEKIMEGE